MGPPTVFGDCLPPLKSPLTPMFAGAVSTLHLISAVGRDPQEILSYILALEKQNSDLKALIHSSSKDIYLATSNALSSVKVEFGNTITPLDSSLRAKGDEQNHLLMRKWITEVGHVVYAADGLLMDLLARLDNFVSSAFVKESSAKSAATGEKRKERYNIGNDSDDDAMEWTANASGKKVKARKSNSMSVLRMSNDNSGMSMLDENIGSRKRTWFNIKIT